MSECKRCGNEALRDFRCRNCGEYGMADVDEGGCFYEEDGSLFEVHPKGDEGPQVVCECGCKEFDVEFDDHCGWCAHQIAKDKD